MAAAGLGADPDARRGWRVAHPRPLGARTPKERPRPTVPAMPKGPAIAVLPFLNLSGDPKQDYFSDGLTEDILTELSRARDLRVLARNTSFQYKGKAVDVTQARTRARRRATCSKAASSAPTTASASRRSSSTPRPAPTFGPTVTIARWPTSSSSRTRSSARSSPRSPAATVSSRVPRPGRPRVVSLHGLHRPLLGRRL